MAEQRVDGDGDAKRSGEKISSLINAMAEWIRVTLGWGL
jgi:hypothetical protein